MKKTFYELPPEDCERLNRHEMQALRWLIGALHVVATAIEDLDKRLECIPNGKRRYHMMHGHLNAIVNDLIGTVTIGQAKQINGTIKDMTMQFVPKMTPPSHKAVVSVDDLSYLVQHAQNDESLCQTCVLDDEHCRSCEMYKILEAIAPRDDWGTDVVCPYLTEKWWKE